MNKQRRKEIGNIIRMIQRGMPLEDAVSYIENVKDDEEYALDNFPENLQDSFRGQGMQDAIENLEEAIEAIENEEDCNVVIDFLNNARWV